jgi:pimeloyl-ACP methyl ester carboxylesterase
MVGSPTVWNDASGPIDAPAIVLVHGAMDRSAGLLRLSRRLSDRFRVIRYDRRGYGRSTEVGPPFTIDAHIEDLAALVDEATAGEGVCLAFGHSLGGNVALGLAQRRPELVDRVAIYESPLSWLPWWPERTAGSAALGTPDPADAAEAFMRRLVSDEKWERLPPSTRAARRAEGAAMVGELADLRAHAPWDGERVARPVLALCGERAHEHHRLAFETLPTLLPGCRRIEIPDAGHFGPNTHADVVAAALTAFIESAPVESDGRAGTALSAPEPAGAD